MDVVQRFFAVADGAAQRLAVQSRDRDTTFAELGTLARRFAARFAAIPSAKVLIAYEQGLNAYAAMWGAMLAGACYAPVNVSSPRDKIAAIAQSFEPDLIVGETAPLDGLVEAVPRARRLAACDIEGTPPLPGAGIRNANAYVIFTSGSTGTPKGVVISHAALAHYIDWVVRSGLYRPGDRSSQYSNIGFDLSVLDIVGALCCGATLVPFVSRGDRLMPAQGIRAHGITVWTSVPSVVSLMLRAKQATAENLAGVERFFLIGEPLLEMHVAALFAACPRAEVWNAYGPTEATVSMTVLKLTAETYADAVTTSVALGSPIPGMELYVLGGDSAESGELVIVGPQLAEGYWNAPEQSARSFRVVELQGLQRRAYFSGDWVRWRDGHLYFETRVDQQIKIDGFRLELDEVAAALRSLGWAEVAVFTINGAITAVLESKSNLTAAQIERDVQAKLKEKLERYALPTQFVVMPEFPRNQNDKIDLLALKRMAESTRR